MQDEQKQQLILDNMLELHHNYARNNKYQKRNQMVMAQVEQVDKFTGTGFEFISHFTKENIGEIAR